MLEKVTRWAEKVANHAGLSRRGFLERIGQGAVALVGVLGGVLAVPAAARAMGSPCTTNGDCGAGQYCAKSIGQCGGPGQCMPLPRTCPKIRCYYACGCDGKTYCTGCYAAQAGVNVRHNGAC
jgi:hypothetical protein